MPMPEAATAALPLWQPSPDRIAKANITAFRTDVERRHGLSLPDYQALWRWSVDQPALFWREMWSFGRIIGDPGDVVLVDADRMPGARFFPNGRLNFAQNLLRRSDDTPALIF